MISLNRLSIWGKKKKVTTRKLAKVRYSKLEFAVNQVKKCQRMYNFHVNQSVKFTLEMKDVHDEDNRLTSR